MTTTTTGLLTDRAMLVNLTIKQWSAAKHDRKISSEVAQQHNSAVDMGRFNKKLYPPKALDEVKKVAGAWRTDHYNRTLPWNDDGPRILSSEGFFPYRKASLQFEADFNGAADRAANQYPDHYEEARRLLNGLFNPADYPTVDEFRRKFFGGVNIFPLPTADDFRVNLGQAATDLIKQDIQDNVNQALERAMSDVWERIKDVVSAMATKLRNYKVTADGTEGVFRDSLVENVRDLVSILPSLNITNNPDIAAFTVRLQTELCAHSADTLRASSLTRESTAEAAEKILRQMEDFI